MAVRDIEPWMCLSKNLNSTQLGIFSFLRVKVLGEVLCYCGEETTTRELNSLQLNLLISSSWSLSTSHNTLDWGPIS